MPVSIKGSVALVTGANRGIGRAFVDALLAQGAAKVYAGTRQPQSLEALAAGFPGRLVPLTLDVQRDADIRAAADAARDVTLLINNAGVARQLGGEFSDVRWLTAAREEIEVNVLGLLALTQAFAPILARNGGGAILNLSSVAGLVSFPVLASYSVSKAAVHSLTQAMRAMLRANGTFVAGAYPGPIDTDMARDIPLEKTPPAVAATAMLAGLEAGEEEIFPDPVAREIGAKFLRDPKGLEREMARSAG